MARMFDTRKYKYKEFRICKSCGQRFEVKHRLRLHCNECKYVKVKKRK